MNDLRALHCPVLGEPSLKIGGGHRIRQVANVKFLSHGSSPCGKDRSTPWNLSGSMRKGRTDGPRRWERRKRKAEGGSTRNRHAHSVVRPTEESVPKSVEKKRQNPGINSSTCQIVRPILAITLPAQTNGELPPLRPCPSGDWVGMFSRLAVALVRGPKYCLDVKAGPRGHNALAQREPSPENQNELP